MQLPKVKKNSAGVVITEPVGWEEQPLETPLFGEDGIPTLNNSILSRLGAAMPVAPAPEAIDAQMPARGPATAPARKNPQAPQAAPEQASAISALMQSLGPQTSPYGNEFGKDAVAEAQARRDQERDAIAFNRASQQILQGAAKRKGGSFTPDNEMLKMSLESAENPLKDMQAQRDLADKELVRSNALIQHKDSVALGDPNSDISKIYRETAAKKLKMALPENVSASQLDKLLPQLKSMVDGEMTEYQRRSLELAEQRLDLGYDKEGRMKDTLNWSKTEKDELSDAQAKDLYAIDNSMGALGEIKELKALNGTGPIEGRIANWRLASGLDDAKMSVFKLKLGRQLANYVKSISGTAASDAERANLELVLPNAKHDDATFIANLLEFQKELKNSRSRLLEAYRRQGKSVESNLSANQGLGGELAKGKTAPKKASGPAPGSVVMVKGKKYRVGANGDDLEEVK